MLRIVLTIASLLFLAALAQAERRVALVLAADDYETVRPLKNAVNDGRAVEQALEALEFEVSFETDRDLRRMRRALDDFREDAAGADVALVFFAGHGVEILGENRLLPVDADALSVERLKATSLPLEEVREAVTATAKVALIVLDACRNDPFGSAAADGRSAVALGAEVADKVKPGLGRVGKAENVLFAFAAAPGETASDGDAGNSPFSTALIKYLGTEGLEIRSVLTLVQQEVYDRSQGRQLPYVESGLPRLFFAGTASGPLPERERLLLAMAELTPSLRAEVETIAAEKEMPLAPLYGALIGSAAGKFSREERTAKLREAADAFVTVQREMRRLASADPDVTRLRHEAEGQLSLGAFDAARKKLAEAAGIDGASRASLKANYVERTLSEAATHYIAGGAARADLKYDLAIDDFKKSVALYDELNTREIPRDARRRRIQAYEQLGDSHVIAGHIGEARKSFETVLRLVGNEATAEPQSLDWQFSLSAAHLRIGDIAEIQGDTDAAEAAYSRGTALARAVFDRRPDVAATENLIRGYDTIGLTQRARGDRAGAAASFAAAHDLALRLRGDGPLTVANGGRLAFSLDRVALTGMERGDRNSALAAARASYDLRLMMSELRPGDPEILRPMSVTLTMLGDLHLGAGAEQLKYYEAALTLRHALAEADPANTVLKADLASVYSKIGVTHTAGYDFAAARQAYEAGFAFAVELAALDPGNGEWRRRMAEFLRLQCQSSYNLQDFDRAIETGGRGIALLEELRTANPADIDLMSRLATAHGTIASPLWAKYERSRALDSYRAALGIWQDLARRDPVRIAWREQIAGSQASIGDLLAAIGDPLGAAEAWQAAVATREALVREHPGNDALRWALLETHWRIARPNKDPVHYQKALGLLLELQREGRLPEERKGWIRFARDQIDILRGN